MNNNYMNSLDIAIPLFNEEDSIENLSIEIIPILESLKDKKIDSRLILVNDGSADKTEEKLKEFFNGVSGTKIINHEKNKNLGGFLRTIQKEMSSDFVVFLDSDCTFSPSLILEMIKTNLEEVDIVNGSPYHPKGKIDGVKQSRLIISKTANYLYRNLVSKEVYTFTSIFKMYRSEKIKNIEIHFNDFVAVAELFIKSIILGSKVLEFPATLSIRQTGESKIRILQSIINHLKLMILLLTKKIS